MKKETKSRVAGEVDAYCTKCKMDLNHVIVAKVADRIARVKCLTCNTEHAYRRPQAGEEREARAEMRASRKTPGSHAKPVAETEEVRWEREVAAAKGVAFKRYKMNESYADGDFLDHEKFGRGKVLRVETPRSAAVLFRTGVKLLAINYDR